MTLEEQINDFARQGLLGMGLDDQKAQDIAPYVGLLAQFVPGVGLVTGGDNTIDAINDGRYGDAAIEGGLTLLGEIPGVGDLAASAIRGMRRAPDGLMRMADEFDEEAWIKANPRPHADIPYSQLNESEMRDYMNWHAAKGRAKRGVGPREQVAPRNENFSEEEWLENNPHPFPDRRVRDLSPEEERIYRNWHAAKSRQKHRVEKAPPENLFSDDFDRLAWEAENPNPVPNKRQKDMNAEELKSYKSWIAKRHYAGRKDKAEVIKRGVEAAAKRRKAEPGPARARVAKRRSARLQRTPPHASQEKIQEIYEAAAEASLLTGVPHEVDHVIPLQGRNVSGLHHQDNLLVVPQSANRSKGAQFEPGDLPPRAGIRNARALLKKIRQERGLE